MYCCNKEVGVQCSRSSIAHTSPNAHVHAALYETSLKPKTVGLNHRRTNAFPVPIKLHQRPHCRRFPQNTKKPRKIEHSGSRHQTERDQITKSTRLRCGKRVYSTAWGRSQTFASCCSRPTLQETCACRVESSKGRQSLVKCSKSKLNQPKRRKIAVGGVQKGWAREISDLRSDCRELSKYTTRGPAPSPEARSLLRSSANVYAHSVSAVHTARTASQRSTSI